MSEVYMLRRNPEVVLAKRILQVATGVVDLQNPMKSKPAIWVQCEGENEVRIMQIGLEPADNVLTFRPVAGDYFVRSRNEDKEDREYVVSKSEFELQYELLSPRRKSEI